MTLPELTQKLDCLFRLGVVTLLAIWVAQIVWVGYSLINEFLPGSGKSTNNKL